MGRGGVRPARPRAGTNNTLSLDVQATIRVNDASDPIYLFVEGEAIGIPISDTCDVYVRDFTVSLSAEVQAELVIDPLTGATTTWLSTGLSSNGLTVLADGTLVLTAGDDMSTVDWLTGQ